MNARASALRDFVRSFGVAAPPALVAAWLILRSDAPVPNAWFGLGAGVTIAAIYAARERFILARRLRTVSAVLASYREGDLSIRARPKSSDALLADVLEELNQLGDTLRGHRLGEMEAWSLLRKVMAEVDVVVLAFDAEGRVRLANDAAARLIGKSSSRLVGEEASALGLGDLLQAAAPRVIRNERPWELRRGAFRLSGEPHTLVVLSDMTTALRDNERDAWRRLIRVMGHEINNSLAPIQSLAGTLAGLLRTEANAEERDEDLARGLDVIGRRAEALGRFMNGYALLARLPPPRFLRVDLGALVRKTAALEQRLAITIGGGPDTMVFADADQLEHALINLFKNAVEATRAGDGAEVAVSWTSDGSAVEIVIDDEGAGVSETTNLFVPFFTTKSDGSGIGLVLSRQIVEAHDGQLTLVSRDDRSGARARIRLPLRGGAKPRVD